VVKIYVVVINAEDGDGRLLQNIGIRVQNYMGSIPRGPQSFFSYGSAAQFWALATSMKLSASFRLLDLGQSAGLLGWVISSLQGLCVAVSGDYEDGEVGGMNGFGTGN
jgi:hypothetical protein